MYWTYSCTYIYIYIYKYIYVCKLNQLLSPPVLELLLLTFPQCCTNVILVQMFMFYQVRLSNPSAVMPFIWSNIYSRSIYLQYKEVEDLTKVGRSRTGCQQNGR